MLLTTACQSPNSGSNGASGGPFSLTASYPQSSSSTPTLAPSPKKDSANGLFSAWTDSGGLFVMDLSAAQFDISGSIQIYAVTGQTCSCQGTIEGTDLSGVISVTSCTSNDYPDCNNFVMTSGQYTRSNSGLQICDQSNNCRTYVSTGNL